MENSYELNQSNRIRKNRSPIQDLIFPDDQHSKQKTSFTYHRVKHVIMKRAVVKSCMAKPTKIRSIGNIESALEQKF